MILLKLQATARKLLWPPGRAQRLYGFLKNVSKNLTLTQVAFAVVFVPTLFYLYDETTHHVLIVDSINLPEDKNGFTSAVMVNQIGDALRRIEAVTRTQMNKDSVRLPQEVVSPPAIEVPGAKLGINDLVAILRSVFRIYPQRITGDLVLSQIEPPRISNMDTYRCDNVSPPAEGPVAVAVIYATSAGRSHNSSVRFVVPHDDMDGLVQCTAEVVLKQVNPYVLAVYKKQQGNGHASLQIIDEMLQDPSLEKGIQIAAYILQGNMLSDRKDYNEAIKKYQMALALDPKDAMVYDDWGVAIDDQNQGHDPEKYQAAIEKFQAAIKLDPKSANAYLNWAIVIDKQNRNQKGEPYRAAKEYPAAIEKFQTSIRLDPRDAVAHKNLGDVYHNGGEYEEADAEYRKATELDSKYAIAFKSWADVFLEQRDYPEAVDRYQKAMQLDANDKTYNNWGAALEDWGNSDRDALASDREKLRHNAHDAAARKDLAEAQDQQKKLLEAQKQFDKIHAPAEVQKQ